MGFKHLTGPQTILESSFFCTTLSWFVLAFWDCRIWRLGMGLDRKECGWNQGAAFKSFHSMLFTFWSRAILFLVPVMNDLLPFPDIVHVEIGSKFFKCWDNSWNIESTQQCWLVLGKGKTVEEPSKVTILGWSIRNWEKPMNISLVCSESLTNSTWFDPHRGWLKGSFCSFHPRTSQTVSRTILH